MTTLKTEYRAHDTTTDVHVGPIRSSLEDAEHDASAHNSACHRRGGYGSAEVITRDPESPSRSVRVRLDGSPSTQSVWPSHGSSCGAVEFD